jgi:hypothetical protein
LLIYLKANDTAGEIAMTSIRRLDGITYWVIESPEDMHEFINTEIRKEWTADARDEGRDPQEDPWLQGLSSRRWVLEVLPLDEIKPNPYEFIPRIGYNFEERLAKRSEQLRKAVETYGSVIWPVIVRHEDMQLIDGYCRFATLRAMNIPRMYAYVGRK